MVKLWIILLSNLNNSDTDGSLTMVNSNSFFESQRNSSDSSKNQVFRVIFFFYHEIVCCVNLIEEILMSTYSVPLRVEDRKDVSKLSPFASRPGARINPQWLELPISRTNFQGPKDVRAIKVRLYIGKFCVLGRKRTYKMKYVLLKISENCSGTNVWLKSFDIRKNKVLQV